MFIKLFSFVAISSYLIIIGDFNIYTSIFSAFFSVCLFLQAYRKNKISFFILMQFIIASLWCVASLYYIELGNFISEQKRYGENVGSLVRYLFYMFLFLYPAYVTVHLLTKKKLIKNFVVPTRYFNFFNTFTIGFFSILILFAVFVLAKYGIPLLKGINRFEYYKLIEPFDKIVYLMPICAFFIGITVAVTNSKLGILSLFCILVILVLFSDKFSGIFGVLIYYTMGFYLSKNIYNRTISIGLKKKIIFLYLPIIFMFLLSVVVVGFIYLQGASDNDLVDRILARALGLQAHVWYGIDEQMFTKAIDFDPEIFFLQSDEPIQPAGLEYLMYQVADYDFVRAFREAGIRFTNGYPSIVLISFGYVGSIFVLPLLGMILGYMLYYILLKVYYMQPLRLLISLVLYNNIIVNIFIMGEIYYIYKPLFLLCLFIIFIDTLVFQHRNISISKVKFNNRATV